MTPLAIPMNVRIAVRRRLQLHHDGRVADAVDAYHAILERHPDTCACWCNLGATLGELGRKDEGLEMLREGVLICPQAAADHA